MEEVILVDESDNAIGTCEKLLAHQDGGKLHRAFSVFIFHPDGRLMLQQRAKTKYHFGGLWTNTCCSHPHTGEVTLAAAIRRLQEEMGFVVDLTEKTVFTYKALDPQTGLTEHEIDHVFVGVFSGEPTLNLDEVAAWRWVKITDLEMDLLENPHVYTPWFPIAFDALQKK
jgi:isopentenyl-diphosphate Delta-isomerase